MLISLPATRRRAPLVRLPAVMVPVSRIDVPATVVMLPVVVVILPGPVMLPEAFRATLRAVRLVKFVRLPAIVAAAAAGEPTITP